LGDSNLYGEERLLRVSKKSEGGKGLLKNMRKNPVCEKGLRRVLFTPLSGKRGICKRKSLLRKGIGGAPTRRGETTDEKMSPRKVLISLLSREKKYGGKERGFYNRKKLPRRRRS